MTRNDGRYLNLVSNDREFGIIKTTAPTDSLCDAIFNNLEEIEKYNLESLTEDLIKMGYLAEVIECDDFSIDNIIIENYERNAVE